MCVDPSGYACWLSNAYAASYSDARIHHLTFQESLIPSGYFEIGDGGFMGCSNCLTPFKLSTINSKFMSRCFVSISNYQCVFQTKFGYGQNGIIQIILKQCYVGTIDNNIFKGYSYGIIESIKSKRKCFIVNEKVELEVEGKVKRDNTGLFVTEFITKDAIKISVDGYKRDLFSSFAFKSTIDNQNLCIKVIKANPKLLQVYNTTLSSIRILVENFFGRMNVLFAETRLPFVLDAKLYNQVNRVVTALTNCHVYFYPLRRFPFYKFHLKNDATPQEKYELTAKIVNVLNVLSDYIDTSSQQIEQEDICEINCVYGSMIDQTNDVIMESTIVVDKETDLMWIKDDFMLFCLTTMLSSDDSNTSFVDFTQIMFLLAQPGNSQATMELNEIIERIIKCSMVLIPCCKYPHWTLLFKFKNDFYFIDSNCCSLNHYEDVANFYKKIKQKYNSNYEEIQLHDIKVEQQHDGFSCGYRIFMYMALIYYYNPFPPDLLSKVELNYDHFKRIEKVYNQYYKLESKRMEAGDIIESDKQFNIVREIISEEDRVLAQTLSNELLEIGLSYSHYFETI